MINYFTLAQITTVADTTALASEEPGELSLSFFSLAIKGGWIMIPIVLLSIVAIYIFIERYFAIKNAAKTDINFMNKIKDYIYDDKLDTALALCQSINSPVARMIEKGIQRIGRPLNDINTAVENVGNLEITKLENGLPTLATVS
ncbi:MAG: MotA/TolQ/ExbB proton channel family protein, partial [Bacteroidota bacterium]|nr:MotA/TolQ/ExbB proton channel family protein [Bacteroidota bacterium]